MESQLYAVDARSGRLRWKKAIGRPGRQPYASGVFAAPAVVGETIYVAANDGLHAFDTTGEPRWHFETPDVLRGTPTMWAGRVYFGSADDDHPAFYALADSGKLLWRVEVGAGILGPAALENGVLYFGCSDWHVYAISAADGALRWRYKTEGMVHAPPAVRDGVVYAGSLDGAVYALDADTGERRWAWQTDSEIHDGPSIAGGVLYLRSYDGHVYAFDRGPGPFPEGPWPEVRGRFLWRHPTGEPWGTSPVPADGVVVFGSSSGHLRALD